MTQKDLFRRPLGLVLSGGGALGSWQAAALLGLESAGLDFDSILGFSAGALTGIYSGFGRLSEAVDNWRRHQGGTLRLSPRLFPPSLFSDAPIREAVPFIASDDEARAGLRRRLIVVSALRSRQRAVYPEFTPGGRSGWDGPLLSHLLASCAIPLIFPPVRLTFRGAPVALFDGGVPCAEPMSFLSLASCRDIVVLDVVRPEEAGRRGGGVFGRIDQRARETMLHLIGQGLSSLKDSPEPPRIFRLAPSKTLEYTMLDFNNTARIRASIDQGAADAADFLARTGRSVA